MWLLFATLYLMSGFKLTSLENEFSSLFHTNGNFSRRRFRNDGSSDNVDSDAEQHDDENRRRRRKREAQTLTKVS